MEKSNEEIQRDALLEAEKWMRGAVEYLAADIAEYMVKYRCNSETALLILNDRRMVQFSKDHGETSLPTFINKFIMNKGD